jgi:hypothetical protein
VRKKLCFFVHDIDLPSMDFVFSPRFTIVYLCYVGKQCVGIFNPLAGEEPSDLRMRVPPRPASFDGLFSYPDREST